jgi:hypothetical protein
VGAALPRAKLSRVELHAPLSETGGDRIRLVLPAEPDYGRIARVAASSLALRLGLTFVEIEDLRIAVDEACSVMLVTASYGALHLRYRLEGSTLSVELRARLADAPACLPQATRALLEVVTSQWWFTADGSSVVLGFVARRDLRSLRRCEVG